MPQVKRAFTLIELLVVIAIIALLVSILLPALSQAKRAGQNTVSLANLRSLGQVISLYGHDTKDQFVNPFARTPQWGQWNQIMVPGQPGWVWNMSLNAGPRATEPFGFHWASLMMQYFESGGLTSKVQFAPGDETVLRRFYAHMATNPNLENVIWDGSYWYPPTFWLAPARYQTQAVVPVNINHVRRNRFDEVLFPQAKVMVFERFDFSKRSRSSPIGRVNLPPQFNHPESDTRFVAVDGSVDSAKMRRIYALTADPHTPTATEFTPCGTWNMPPAMMSTYDMHQDNLEYGQPQNGNHPAYFWSTYKGIQGRDINR